MIHFKNAQEAFEFYYNALNSEGHHIIDFDGTKALFNIGFYINNPADNHIYTSYRNWKQDYAEAEWEWYLTGDKDIHTLGKIYGKIPDIWIRMADENGEVNSNYGHQWEREFQLDRIVGKLKENPNTRQAVISIYDGKEIYKYRNDTPCTTAIQFSVVNNKLNMCVTMRSNDLWYGFCNDQYCFSELQLLVAERTGYDLGSYFHFAHNLHLYERNLGKNSLLQRKADHYA